MRRQYQDGAAALAELKNAVGATVAEVLAAIAECSARRDGARRDLPEASRRAKSLAVAEGRAMEVVSAGVGAVSTAAALVESAGARLGRAVVLPGVAEAALASQWVWEGSDVIRSARELRSQVGEGGSVSDQVVFNRLMEMEDGLAGGYDVVYGEEDGVKFFFVADDTGRQPLPAVAARVEAANGRW
ncbi:MAG: hypothetical protein M3083_11415 [Actinomycetota bacterium]|nr:hypothetical protein [Actinomycetota bacterium]